MITSILANFIAGLGLFFSGLRLIDNNLERIRQNYLEEAPSVGSSDRAVLLQVTSTFERVVWMAQRLARLIAH